LVTGGAGFIGSHLVDALITKGAHIKVVDDLSRGTLQNLNHCNDKIEFYKGDLTNPEIAKNAMQDCEICYHLAAVVGDVRWMNTHPSEIFKSLLIDHQVIDACRKTDIDKLLYASSACTYPVGLQANADLPPLKEEDILRIGAAPDGDYGWVKLIGEIQCKSYHEIYGTEVAIVRPFNPYGPRESFNSKDSHVIPALIRRALNRENPFIVWGNGEQRRAFTYVTDLVEGIILASEKLSDAEPINLGEFTDTSIRELAELILKITNCHPKITYDTSKPQGVSVRKSDMSKASKLLDWTPKVTLEEGIKRSIDWYLKNKRI
jgi:nucleoside-diphosphate-sugar epimerase